MSDCADRFILKVDSMKVPIQYLDADVGKFHLGGDYDMLYLFPDTYERKLVMTDQDLYPKARTPICSDP